MRQHIYKVCYSRYQVPLYLWRIGPILKHGRGPKYHDRSSVKRHKDRWYKGSNSSTCTTIPSSSPEIITLPKQYKSQQSTILDEDNDATKIITTQEMLLETAVPVTEDDSRSDADYYDEKSTLTKCRVSRYSTHFISIVDSSCKPKKNQKTLLSFKYAKTEQESTLNDIIESTNNFSIEIKMITSQHKYNGNNALNDRNESKALERVKKVENINETMEATDLI